MTRVDSRLTHTSTEAPIVTDLDISPYLRTLL
jgi:hypothetical protein